MALRSLPLLLTVVAGLAVPLQSQQSDGEARTEETETALLTLKKLFPEKGLFGPSATALAFSHDGKHAAYLYRPYAERRHGPDLWLYDVSARETRRLTSLAMMARFQKTARKVEEQQQKERADKGKKWFESLFSGKVDRQREDDKDEGGEDDKDENGGEGNAGASRYGGIDSFTWSPNEPELLFTASGDIYRWRVGDDQPQRLTMTREREHDVQYLPAGGGYTFLRGGSAGGRRRGGDAGRGNALIKVEFGSHLVTQLDPELADGESMSGYRFSDDGKHVVFLASKGDPSPEGGERKVNIARYRDRFMQVQEVPRHVSDDPMPAIDVSVYLYDVADAMIENGTLTKVYTFKRNNPRDSFRVPSWSPDSSRVAFCVYKAETGQVHLMEVEVGAARKKSVDDGGKADRGRRDAKAAPAAETAADHDHVARVVHRFLHDGGPTTPAMITPYYLSDSRHIVFLSEQSGFRHLHILDPKYESVRQLTHGHFEVYPIDLSTDRKWMFVLATKEDPACQDVYRVAVDDGRIERLSQQRGYYSDAVVGADGRTVLANFVCYGTGPELVSIDATGEQKTLTDSHPKSTLALIGERPTFFTYQNRSGQDIHGTMFKPKDWSPADKRPLLVYVYGGPLGTRKNVVEGSYAGDGYLFGRYMTERHGYVTCTIDPRGMSGYGGMFEKANYEQVGKPQVEDLVDGVEFMIANHGVDKKRVGIHGWSFGGFQTQMCLYTEPDTFACGIAGAGPTEWENYNSWYSLGTIGPSRPGQPDLKKFSLLPLAKNLKSKLLLVHGMEDSNVLYQDTVRVYRELLKAGKETLVELFLDPTGGHGLGGDVKRLGKARKYEEFFVRVLGEGERSRQALDTTVAEHPQVR